MKLVLIGIPGAGKSTQGNLLSKQLKIPYLSTGHIFREIAKEKTKLGRYVKEVLNSGLLIPDNRTIEIVNSYLSKSEYKNGYILDGFPRTVNQARKFTNNVDKVIYLEIPDKEALWRLAYRNDTTRNDDTVQAIRKRIEIFHKYTEPVIQYYEKKGILVILDGTLKIKEINKDILKSLGKQLIRNQIKSWERKNKAIIAITGMPGSGKSEAATFFQSKGLPVISFSDTLNDYI
ncbi:MAG TPA: nucleoside monophosphate kinase, partial [Candidatus Nitrosocosmicus sp.]|nr:nucleoside monophosphate kinase [Candidatus Nitrosocosmicus sp.]